MRGFSGHLPPDQLLVLWDLVSKAKLYILNIYAKLYSIIIIIYLLQILGFDSLEILPLFAIIILSFRKESLMQVSSLDSIEAILADLSSIKVLPLVQLALSRD